MLSRLLTLALLVTAPLVSAETLDLTNAKSNAAATVLVARFFESLGLDVNNKDEVQFGLRFGGYGLVLTPIVSAENGGKLNAYINYTSNNPANLENPKLLSLVNEINLKYNYVSAYVDQDGDLCFRYVLVFDKQLEPKLVQRWLKQIEVQTNAIRAEYGAKLKPFLAKKEK
ncbi:MAG: putative bacterial sensory transduction regulator [Verrucomicrobiota bacterium]|jgi:hypothetical protein